MGEIIKVLGRAQKNYIINGGFDIWQRGVSIVMTSNDQTFQADRFKARSLNNVSLNTTISQMTDVPNTDSSFSMNVAVNTAEASLPAAGIFDIRYVAEGNDIVALQNTKFTVSFWVKSNKTGLYNVSLVNNGTDRRFNHQYTVDVADTWEKKSVVVDAIDASVGSWNLTNGIGFELVWTLGIGSNLVGSPNQDVWENGAFLVENTQVNLGDTIGNYLRISQVMINEGQTPSSFKRAGKNISEEFSSCQRYYQLARVAEHRGYVNNALRRLAVGGPLAVEMRTTPTVTWTSDNFVNIRSASSSFAGISVTDPGNVRFFVESNAAGEVSARINGTLEAEL